VAAEGADNSCVGDDEGGEDGAGGRGREDDDAGRQEQGCRRGNARVDDDNDDNVNDEQATASKTARLMYPPPSFPPSVDIDSLSARTDYRTSLPFRQSSSFDYLVAAAEVTSEDDLS